MEQNPLGSPVAKKLVADQVYDVLESWIFDGRLQPGAFPKVREVAAMVGTSVTPVREALRKLEDVGLVTTQPHRGAVVAEAVSMTHGSLQSARRRVETHVDSNQSIGD